MAGPDGGYLDAMTRVVAPRRGEPRRVAGPRRLALIAITCTLLAAACGGSGDHSGTAEEPAGKDRVVEVVMTDNAFEPTAVSVGKGERVTFRFENRGEAVHEAVFGDEATQAEHGADMAAMNGDGMSGDDMDDMDHEGMDHEGMDHGPTGAVVLEPGESAELSKAFDEAGTTLIGCHQPRHWEGGMKATLTGG